MRSTIRNRREHAEYLANHVAVIGPGYTLDIHKNAAAAGLERGVLRKHTDGFYYVLEPFGYCDVLDLPTK